MPRPAAPACSCSSERRTVPCWPHRTSSVQTAVWRKLFVSARLFRQNLFFARKHGSGRRFPHRTRQKRRRAYIAIPRGRAPEIQAQDGCCRRAPVPKHGSSAALFTHRRNGHAGELPFFPRSYHRSMGKGGGSLRTFPASLISFVGRCFPVRTRPFSFALI